MIYKIMSHTPVQLIITLILWGRQSSITIYILHMNKPRLKLMILWRSQDCEMADPTATEVKWWSDKVKVEFSVQMLHKAPWSFKIFVSGRAN